MREWTVQLTGNRLSKLFRRPVVSKRWEMHCHWGSHFLSHVCGTASTLKISRTELALSRLWRTRLCNQVESNLHKYLQFEKQHVACIYTFIIIQIFKYRLRISVDISFSNLINHFKIVIKALIAGGNISVFNGIRWQTYTWKLCE